MPCLFAALGGCLVGDVSPLPDVEPGQQRLVDDVVGASVVVPDAWATSRDPALFATHGFFVHDAVGTSHSEVARIALAYDTKPDALETVVADKLAEYEASAPKRVDLELPDGRPAVAITGLPGTAPFSLVYTSDGDRVYEIGIWNEAEDSDGIDARGLALLDSVRFAEPTVPIASLALARHDEALYVVPPADVADANAAASARRRVLALTAADHDPGFAAAIRSELIEPPLPGIAANGCGFTAPASLYWQLQWDETNTFYSGTYYNLRARPGWSAMSGNFGSWWGTNYHVGLCYTGRSNQYYANDWPAQHWANAYAAFSGTVEWAGWGTDGFRTLGRYVVVRNGQYRSTTAHLSGIRQGVQWGAWIDGYWDTIGWAGDTGGPWDPHLHARVSWGESLTWNGQPYGGQSVQPLRLRCFDCTDQDVNAAGGGGYYNSFWHGRWMRY